MKRIVDIAILVFMAGMLCLYVVMNIIPQRIQTPVAAPEAYVRKAHYLAHELLLIVRGTDPPVLSLDMRGRGRVRFRMTAYTAQGTDRDGDAVFYLRVAPGLLSDLSEGKLAGAEWSEGEVMLSLRAAGGNVLRFPGRKVYLLDGRRISTLVPIARAGSLQ